MRFLYLCEEGRDCREMASRNNNIQGRAQQTPPEYQRLGQPVVLAGQAPLIHIYYSFDTGEYHESVGLVFTRVPQARA